MIEIDEIQNKNAKFKLDDNQVKVFLGDVLKFGRVRFRIRDLVTENKETAQDKNPGLLSKFRRKKAVSKVQHGLLMNTNDQSELNATGYRSNRRSTGFGDDLLI
jgi:hypothetical protein